MSVHDLGRADSGTKLEITAGDTVRIFLNEISSAGYRWEVERADPTVLRREATHIAPGPAVGSGASRVFEFTAIGAGETFVGLKLWREWLGDKSIADRFQVTIRVK